MNPGPSTASEPKLHGFSPWSVDQLLGALRSGRGPSDLPGDFALAHSGLSASGGHAEHLVTSGVAATPYYYTQHQGAFVHGASIFDVARRARLPWKWNARAVHSMALLEHTLGEDTLHEAIHRVRPASTYTFRNGQLEVTTDERIRDAFGLPEDQDSEEVREILLDVMKQTVASRPVAISLSGGYDSRAVLAMCLALGGKPAIATAGTADATDPRIAMAISREVGLDCRRVEICPEDYLACGRDISRATSGMKSIAHWHTYLYARATGFDPGCIHLVGANGEQVRTYYFDKGILARVANLAPPIAVKHFFRLKFDPKRRLRGVPVESFLQGTGNDCADKVIEACAIEARSANGSFLQRLDRFYTLQRVRHFIGGGIACYQQFNQTTSPFLDSRFVTAGARLSRHDKQCSRFHRSLIARHAPGLLRFPTDDSGLAMADADRAGYWLRKSKETSYSPLRKVLGSAAFRELVIESPLLDQFLIRQTRERLVQAQCNQMLCFLATMHFAAEEAAAATARPADMA